MKITWNENPLATAIELDEHEKKEFWYKLKIEQMEELMFSAHFAITDRLNDMGSLKARTPEEAMAEARKELDPAYWCTDEKSKLDQRVDELMKYYLADLQGQHAGDCTCFAMSCSKCHAESLLGIDTIKGLSKHPGHKISSVFSQWNPVTKEHDLPPVPIEVALEKLRTYDPKPTSDSGWDKVGGFEAHVPRWKAEAKTAYEWLLNYRNEHFPEKT